MRPRLEITVAVVKIPLPSKKKRAGISGFILAQMFGEA
jgi:hypothetical protein